MTRYDIINRFIEKYNFNSFLEIGTLYGETFRSVKCKDKESVDPDPSTNPTHCLPSDEYFEKFDKKFDIIFIDGLHLCEQVDRDIKNALKHLNHGGVIVMHDCHPWSEETQVHDINNHPIAWTGDCWKAFVKNRAEQPYEMYVVDHDCGCGVIDTNKKKVSDTSELPTDMEKMTYSDFVKHPEWMNFKSDIQ